jgi:hypothetical protein
LLDAGAANGDQREFRRDEETVQQDEKDDGDEAKRGTNGVLQTNGRAARKPGSSAPPSMAGINVGITMGAPQSCSLILSDFRRNLNVFRAVMRSLRMCMLRSSRQAARRGSMG